MREILFRGKRLQGGEWVEGYFYKSDRNKCERESGKAMLIFTPDCDTFIYISEAHNSVMVTSETVGQYTGLTDKNGKKIFEGDICFFSIFHYDGSDTQYKGIVTYSGSRYMLWHGKDDEYWGADGGFDLDLTVSCDDEFEVIGNIHDNPELLEVHNEQNKQRRSGVLH